MATQTQESKNMRRSRYYHTSERNLPVGTLPYSAQSRRATGSRSGYFAT